jgi:hypothetical protein
MVQTFDYLAECALSDNFDQLESVRNVVSLLNSIITLFIIETIVDKSLKLGSLDLIFVLTHVIYLIKFIYFSFLELGQIFVRDYLLLCKCRYYRIFNFLF